jgi:hypothetical protein
MSREIIAYYEGVPLFSIQYEVLKALEQAGVPADYGSRKERKVAKKTTGQTSG